MALFRAFATVGGYTAASRVLGFVRDVLIAGTLGAGPLADAFFVAFRFPNLFRRLFAEGAFNAAFVPLFAGRLEAEGEGPARAFAEQALAFLTFWMLVLTAVAMAAMPWLMPVVAPGFVGDPEQFDLAVELTRICFPYLLFMALVALLSGLLNSMQRFAAAAAAPIVLNVCFLAALIFVVPHSDAPARVLAWTVAVAGVAQFLLLVLAARRAGMALRMPRPRLTPGVRRLLQLMGPGLVSSGAMQINLLIGTMIATLQAGAVSWLYYADRVYQLPLGLIGIGLGIVLLPELTRRLRGGAPEAAQHSLNRALELGLFLTLPAAVALAVVPGPIVATLFERGAFGPEDARMTALALLAFAAGLPAFVLVKLLQPAFYAREDTVTPLRFALASVAVNVVLSLALFFAIGFLGIAIATSAAGWVNAGLLAARLRARGHLALDARARRRLPRSLAASVAMGVALWGVQAALAPWLDGAGELQRFAALAGLVTAGLAAYLALAFAARAVEPADLKGLVRRQRTA
jgi:putative peptidoglycan lipid II flippase